MLKEDRKFAIKDFLVRTTMIIFNYVFKNKRLLSILIKQKKRKKNS